MIRIWEHQKPTNCSDMKYWVFLDDASLCKRIQLYAAVWYPEIEARKCMKPLTEYIYQSKQWNASYSKIAAAEGIPSYPLRFLIHNPFCILFNVCRQLLNVTDWNASFRICPAEQATFTFVGWIVVLYLSFEQYNFICLVDCRSKIFISL